MYQGWTGGISAAQKHQNELLGVMEICAEQPYNQYWQNRLAGLLGKEHPALAPTHTTQPLDARSARALELALDGIR